MPGAQDAGRTVRDAIGRELVEARKARDTRRVAVQRALLAAIDNTEAIAAPQRVDYSNPSLGATEADRARLDEVAVRAAFQREHDERVDAAVELRRHGQDDAAAALDAEVAVIASYLVRLPDLLAPTAAN